MENIYNSSKDIFTFEGGAYGCKNKIKELRKQHHITQVEMAKAMQVTRQTIVAIENHHYNPSLELSLKIAKYFGVKVEEIFTLE